MALASTESAVGTVSAPSKAVYIVVNGCHENHMDALLVQRYLGEECQLVDAPDVASADIILVMGCAVTQHMEDESRDLIEQLKIVKRPDAKLIVGGCVAKVKPQFKTGDQDPAVPLDGIERLTVEMNADARRLAVNQLFELKPEMCNFLSRRKSDVFAQYTGVAGRQRLRRLASTLFQRLFGVVRWYKGFIESRLDPYDKNSFAIKISTGCVGECSYCSVRMRRGTVRSKTPDEVLAEFRRGLEQGYRHFVFIGTDIGDYGKDIGLDLIDLLRLVVALPGHFRIRLRNLNPRWLIAQVEEFCQILKSGKISFAQLAIQSGNDRILGLMRRGYRAGDLMKAAQAVRQACPSIVLRTQIIAGFPTESDEDFQDSVKVVESGLFDYADFFRYTHRPHTAAAQIGPDVPFATIMQRYRKLFVKALFRRPLRKVSAISRLHAAPAEETGQV